MHSSWTPAYKDAHIQILLLQGLERDCWWAKHTTIDRRRIYLGTQRLTTIFISDEEPPHESYVQRYGKKDLKRYKVEGQKRSGSSATPDEVASTERAADREVSVKF